MKKLEIRKEDLIYNLNLIKEKLSGKSEILAVVKANGIGLGLVEYTKFLIEQEINFFGVANFDEAITLRDNGINQEILMMSEIINNYELSELIQKDIILTIGNLEEKQKIEEIAKKLGKKVKAHLKIDTGFARYGFLYTDSNIFDAVKSTDNIKVLGCFTHFSKPIDESWTRIQFSRFTNWIEKIKEVNPDIKFHVCGSTAFLKYEDMWLDYVRLGSCVQGRVLENSLGLKKVGNLKTEIITIKSVEKGYNISYSNEYKAKYDMKIAIIGIRIY